MNCPNICGVVQKVEIRKVIIEDIQVHDLEVRKFLIIRAISSSWNLSSQFTCLSSGKGIDGKTATNGHINEFTQDATVVTMS